MVYEKMGYRIELDYPLRGYYSKLLIKSTESESENEIELEIMKRELADISEMFKAADKWCRSITEKAEDEARLILDMDLPMEYVKAHFRKNIYNSRFSRRLRPRQ